MDSSPILGFEATIQTPIDGTDSVPDFAFAFDIDGVLLRSSKPIPTARRALTYLQAHQIPFILLTNSGGKPESSRAIDLSRRLGVHIISSQLVQCHTPFMSLVDGPEQLRNELILVIGTDGENCRSVKQQYGFTNVITPADLIHAYPTLWPFPNPYTSKKARPLPSTIRVSAIFIYSNPLDWGLTIQIIIDLLLSANGMLGTVSSLNNRPDLPNCGYQQDGQPTLYFSNPDLVWASDHHLPRFGQGAFREALEGVWRAVTGGEDKGVDLKKVICGKPTGWTYAFADMQLRRHRDGDVAKRKGEERTTSRPLRKVYMVGDNPESDIRGANEHMSAVGMEWQSILVRSGVYAGGEPAYKPNTIVDDVWEAVKWGVEMEGKTMF